MRQVVFLLFLWVAIPFSAYLLNMQQLAASPQVLAAEDSRDITQLEQINQTRVSEGLSELHSDEELQRVTAIRAQEIVSSKRYQHERADGSIFTALLTPGGNPCENLQLQTSLSITQAVQAWLNSPAHKACLLSSGVREAALHVEFFDRIQMGNDGQHDVYVFVYIAR